MLQTLVSGGELGGKVKGLDIVGISNVLAPVLNRALVTEQGESIHTIFAVHTKDTWITAVKSCPENTAMQDNSKTCHFAARIGNSPCQ